MVGKFGNRCSKQYRLVSTAVTIICISEGSLFYNATFAKDNTASPLSQNLAIQRQEDKSITVDGPEVVAHLPNVDSQFPSVVKEGQRFWFLSYGGRDIWEKYLGTLDNPFARLIWRRPNYEILGMQAPPPNPQVYDKTWITNIYQEPDGGGVLGFIHVEREPKGRYVGKARVALGWSSDYGDTWKYLGYIIEPERDPDSIVMPGSPYIIKDGYFYVYSTETCATPDGEKQRGTSVARAPVNQVLAAAKQGTLIPWHKYYNGNWNSDALGGPCTVIIPISEGHTHTDAGYSVYSHSYFLVLARGGSWQGRTSTSKLYRSKDGINWTSSTLIAEQPAIESPGYNGYHYQVMVDAAGGLSNGTVGKTFYVYAVLFNMTHNIPVLRWMIRQ
jgi:hypothetical protein